MSSTPSDDGLLAVLVERLETQRLPRALALKEKLDQGETLNDFDIAFLEEVFTDARNLKPLLQKHPEYEVLASRMMGLYREITEKALENQRQSPSA